MDQATTERLSGAREGWLNARCRKLLAAHLARLDRGRIELLDAGARQMLGVDVGEPTPQLVVRNPNFYRSVVFGGSIGAAESYMRGDWDADDLTGLIRVLARDRDSHTGLERGVARLRRSLSTVRHRMRKNSIVGSRRNVSDHYDLGNEFFGAFLDPTLSYSAAIFGEGDSLEQASTRKNDLICRKLQLAPRDELLEIGCGWGALAVHAAGRYGCRVVAVTLSREQYAATRERVREAGLTDRVEVLLEDYRQLPARLDRRFEKLVSVEMIEAVGERYLDRYFEVCREMLRPTGLMLLQAIVIADAHYDDYRRSTDFIQRYIFPGGFLPSVTAICRSMARSGGLRLAHLQDTTEHYAETLRHWQRNFRKASARIEALGHDESFQRMWWFYFSYCEAGFRERTVGSAQMLLSGARARIPAITPQS